MKIIHKDIAIIGAGPGGYTAAIRAAQLGAKVVLIEKDEVGGNCLNRGCIPTKTLYRTAEILNTLGKAEQFGIKVEAYKADAEIIQRRKEEVVNQLCTGVKQLLKANSVELLKGEAKFVDSHRVEVVKADGSQEYVSARNFIIAVGSRPLIPHIGGATAKGIWFSEDILNFRSIPQSLAIIGGGVIGMEFAAIFNAFNTKVTVLEYMPNLLPMIDGELTKRLTPYLKRKGIDISVSSRVTKIDEDQEGFSIYYEKGKDQKVIKAEKVLMSVGRTPVIDGLNLEYIGIKYDKKGIKTDENCRTNISNIYAIGDVNGKELLAHAASHQGMRTAEHIMEFNSSEASCKETSIPYCIFVFPEIAGVGITEEQAKQQNIKYKVSKFLFGANGKALTLGEPEGIVKVISTEIGEGSDKTEIIIGVHIMGPHASDLIHEGALAINNKMKVEDIINTVHAHPTLSEAFSEAVMGLKAQSIHMVNKKQ